MPLQYCVAESSTAVPAAARDEILEMFKTLGTDLPLVHSFFVSHRQDNAGDISHTLSLKLQIMTELTCWFDQDVEVVTKPGMLPCAFVGDKKGKKEICGSQVTVGAVATCEFSEYLAFLSTLRQNPKTCNCALFPPVAGMVKGIAQSAALLLVLTKVQGQGEEGGGGFWLAAAVAVTEAASGGRVISEYGVPSSTPINLIN